MTPIEYQPGVQGWFYEAWQLLSLRYRLKSVSNCHRSHTDLDRSGLDKKSLKDVIVVSLPSNTKHHSYFRPFLMSIQFSWSLISKIFYGFDMNSFHRKTCTITVWFWTQRQTQVNWSLVREFQHVNWVNVKVVRYSALPQVVSNVQNTPIINLFHPCSPFRSWHSDFTLGKGGEN